MRFYVLFASSFRRESAPNISHETIDKQRTLCGRRVSDAETFEPDDNDLDPDCAICCKAARKLRANKPVLEEAQIKCQSCYPDHAQGSLQIPCGAAGCECWCNRACRTSCGGPIDEDSECRCDAINARNGDKP